MAAITSSTDTVDSASLRARLVEVHVARRNIARARREVQRGLVQLGAPPLRASLLGLIMALIALVVARLRSSTPTPARAKHSEVASELYEMAGWLALHNGDAASLRIAVWRLLSAARTSANTRVLCKAHGFCAVAHLLEQAGECLCTGRQCAVVRTGAVCVHGKARDKRIA